MDDPCYFNFQALLRVLKLKVISVPFTREGSDQASFATALQQHRPRVYLTGATLSAQTAHRPLVMAAAHGLIIVEDDTFTALEPDLSLRLAILDGLERVIRIGSFSQDAVSRRTLRHAAAISWRAPR